MAEEILPLWDEVQFTLNHPFHAIKLQSRAVVYRVANRILL